MCRKFVLASTLERIEGRFNARLEGTIEISQCFAVSGGDSSYVITSENPHVLKLFKFGMTPYYAKDPMNLINARSEGNKNRNDDPGYTGSKAIFLQPASMKPIHSQRCLVIADAYYEWSDQNKPYLVFLQNKNRPLAFAGIYDHWQNPKSKEIVTSFTIITTTANSLLQSIGVKRMPVIFSKSNETNWIRPSAHLANVLGLLSSYPAEKMNAYPVSEMVNIQGVNDPAMLNPIGDKLQAEFKPASINFGYHRQKTKPDTGATLADRVSPQSS